MDTISIILLAISAVLGIAVIILITILISRSKRPNNSSLTAVPVGDSEHLIQTIDQNLEYIRQRLTKLETIQESDRNSLQSRMNTFSETLTNASGRQEEKIEAIRSSIPMVVQNSVKSSSTESSEYLSRSLDNRFSQVENQLLQKVQELEQSLESRLSQSFNQSAQTLGEVRESLGKVTEAQRNLDSLNSQVTALNSILSNSRTRGRFGELSMEAILHQVFGDTQGVYSLQRGIETNSEERGRKGRRPDAIVRLPYPEREVCIDSKFSFVPYEKFIEGKVEDETAKKEMSQALRREIEDIASKYIVPDQTAEYALMYIPSDGIYSLIQSDDYLYKNVVEYARSKRVVLTSPSTLQPILANIALVWTDFRRQKNLSSILENIRILSNHLDTLSNRWEAFSRDIDSLVKTRDSYKTTFDRAMSKASQIKESEAIEDMNKNSEVDPTQASTSD